MVNGNVISERRPALRPRITALLPAYQAAGFIQATLDSLSAQTYSKLKVIVSVDVCEDDTYTICTAHAERDSRFTVLKQDRRQRYVGNCNFLLRQADADYVCFAFHDDILFPTYVEKLCAALDTHPEAVLAYSDMLLTDEVDCTQKSVSYRALEGLHDPVARGLRLLKRGPPDGWFIPNRGIFRLEESRRIGGLRTPGAGGYAPDMPWLFHMSLLGEFVRVPEILCHKYYRPGSYSKALKHSGAERHAAMCACWREIWRSDLALWEKLRLAIPTKWVVRARLQDILARQ